MLERIKKGPRSLHMHPAKGPRRLHMHPAKTLSKVKSTECMANTKLLAPLPLHNATHPDPAGQPCSSTMVPNSTTQHKTVWPEQHHQQSLLQEQMKSYYHINMSITIIFFYAIHMIRNTTSSLFIDFGQALTTPTLAELTAKVNEKSLPQEQKHEASITKEGPEGKKGAMLVTPHLMTKPKEGRSHPSKQLFTLENRDNVDAGNDTSRTEVSKWKTASSSASLRQNRQSQPYY